MTIFRVSHPLITSLVTCMAISVAAQDPRPPGVPPVVLPAAAPADLLQRPADYIVAIVNSEPITNHQVRLEMPRVARQLAQAQQTVPDPRELAGVALERLITDRALLHQAREIGIKIEESAIDEAEQSVARHRAAPCRAAAGRTDAQ